MIFQSLKSLKGTLKSNTAGCPLLSEPLIRQGKVINTIEYGIFGEDLSPNFNQSEAKRHCFFNSDWLKFGTLWVAKLSCVYKLRLRC